ncbi:hypothetical protein SAMN03159297_03540 [Pseudomonas sp. NFACC45]|nr:hypothetical protein SAMN03159297_03540 [Pseudomonas sp. NFACC45]
MSRQVKRCTQWQNNETPCHRPVWRADDSQQHLTIKGFSEPLGVAVSWRTLRAISARRNAGENGLIRISAGKGVPLRDCADRFRDLSATCRAQNLWRGDLSPLDCAAALKSAIALHPFAHIRGFESGLTGAVTNSYSNLGNQCLGVLRGGTYSPLVAQMATRVWRLGNEVRERSAYLQASLHQRYCHHNGSCTREISGSAGTSFRFANLRTAATIRLATISW